VEEAVQLPAAGLVVSVLAAGLVAAGCATQAAEKASSVALKVIWRSRCNGAEIVSMMGSLRVNNAAGRRDEKLKPSLSK
jgi:hypothetical protein